MVVELDRAMFVHLGPALRTASRPCLGQEQSNVICKWLVLLDGSPQNTIAR